MLDVSIFFQYPIHLILLQREALCRGQGCGGDNLLLTVTMDHKEYEISGLLNDLVALLHKD
jgi:hypothetical protein